MHALHMTRDEAMWDMDMQEIIGIEIAHGETLTGKVANWNGDIYHDAVIEAWQDAQRVKN